MPESIFPINVGQVEAPSIGGGGGSRGGSMGGGSNSLTSLIRFQQKMMEIEGKKQEQAQKNADTLFGGVAKAQGFGIKDRNNVFGITPMNPYQANLIAGMDKEIQDQVQAFTNSDMGNRNYAQLIGNVRKIYGGNPALMQEVATNQMIDRAVSTVKDENLKMHPLFYDQINKFQEAKNPGEYDLSVIKNFKNYQVTPIDHKEDANLFKTAGINYRTVEDPLSGQALIVTSQHNKDKVRATYFQKYGNNFGLDYDLLQKNDPASVSGITRDDYISKQVNGMADAFSTEEDFQKLQIAGKTLKRINQENALKTQQAQQEEAAKNIEKLKLAKEKDAITDENSKLNYERQIGLQKEKGKQSRETVGMMTDAQKEMAKEHGKNVIDYRKVPGVKQEDVNVAVTKVTQEKGESKSDYENRLINKIKETSIPVSTEHLTKVKDDILNHINNKHYRIRGNKAEHSFAKEKTIDPAGFVKGMYKSVSKDAPKSDATIFTGVTDIVVSGGKKVAVGEIVTPYKERFDSVPAGYKSQAKIISDDEKKALKDSGYKIDMSKDYYKVPVEIDMQSSIPKSFSTQTVSGVNSIAGRNNNPGNIRIAGSKEFESYPTLEEGFNASMAEIDKKKEDSPAIKANKKLRGREGKETTVVDLIETWSPRTKYGGDNSDDVVDSYITDVLTTLGITADTPITQVPTAELALSLAKHEDPAVYTELLAIMENNSDNVEQKNIATESKPAEEPKAKSEPMKDQPDYTKPVPKESGQGMKKKEEATIAPPAFLKKKQKK